jgi:glycosyltransferase involved in cell wall biosynthesis
MINLVELFFIDSVIGVFVNLGAFDAVVLSPCGFHLDPRHEYWASSLEASGFQTLRMEVLEEVNEISCGRLLRFQDGLLTVGSNRKRSHRDFLLPIDINAIPSRSPLGNFIKSRLVRMLHAVSHDLLVGLKPTLVVANDLLGAVLAQALWGGSDCKIIYDAQEVFTDSYDVIGGPVFTDKERRAWIDLESLVCKRSDLVVTISPGIAQLYQSRHGVTCEVLPNYVPLDKAETNKSDLKHHPTRFVLIGRADPHRGLEQLVDSWDFPETLATLDLIMPVTPQRQRLEAHSSQVQRKHSGPKFVAGVSPEQMITSLSFYDIGILPYDYPYPYSYASPNKFGEYIAAGLAVLANDQPFVAQQIESYSIGRVFSWKKPGDFIRGVEYLAHPDRHLDFVQKVATAFKMSLNWEVAGAEVWRFIEDATTKESRDLDRKDLNSSDVFEHSDRASILEKSRWYCRKHFYVFARKVWTRFK